MPSAVATAPSTAPPAPTKQERARLVVDHLNALVNLAAGANLTGRPGAHAANLDNLALLAAAQEIVAMVAADDGASLAERARAVELGRDLALGLFRSGGVRVIRPS